MLASFGIPIVLIFQLGSMPKKKRAETNLFLLLIIRIKRSARRPLNGWVAALAKAIMRAGNTKFLLESERSERKIVVRRKTLARLCGVVTINV